MERMKLVNLTPHTLNIEGVGEIPSSAVARLVERTGDPVFVSVGDAKIKCIPTTYTGVEGLPQPLDEGTIYIVSRPVAEYMRHPQVMAPAEYVRDQQGRIIGARALCWFVQ
jgi:hypothetical protein